MCSMKTAEEILTIIAIEKHDFESKNVKSIDNLGCVMSLPNLKILVDDFYNEINQERPELVSSITVYGMKIFPSTFIEDNQFGVFEIKPL